MERSGRGEYRTQWPPWSAVVAENTDAVHAMERSDRGQYRTQWPPWSAVVAENTVSTGVDFQKERMNIEKNTSCFFTNPSFLYLMTENQLASLTIDQAIQIHKKLGPGLLEKVYLECLYYRLIKLGLNLTKEQAIPVIFEEVKMECGYRADLIVENKLVIEINSVDEFADVHFAQLLTYLKFCNCRLGLLINFNVSLLKNGLKRVVNNL